MNAPQRRHSIRKELVFEAIQDFEYLSLGLLGVRFDMIV
jgi:hypothetical protein